MTRVSVISVFYNRGKFVQPSVESLLAQDHGDLEIILVDDQSTDDTLAQLQRFANDPRVRIIAQSNSGFTRSMNNAIRASSGEYIAVHGSGDISLPARLSAQARILDAQPEVGVVGCWVENDEDDGSGTRVLKAPNDLPFAETLLKRNLFTHGEVMFRRAIFDAVGGYREFFSFAQDRDLWMRMSEQCGYRIVTEPLYRRIKLPGGVAKSPEKLLLQTYLSDFAVQCARARRRGERDPLDRHGPAAAFLRERSELFARRIAWQGVKWMLAGNLDHGWTLIKQAAGEFRSRQLMMIRTLAATHTSPLLWRTIGRPLLARRVTSFRASD